MTETRSIVLYGVGSPLAVDVEESCRRLSIAIAGAVKNVAGAHYLLDASVVREVADLDAACWEFHASFRCSRRPIATRRREKPRPSALPSRRR